MLLRTAKLLTGLRLLIAEAAPIIATSLGLLSVRGAAYIVGFALGSIAIGWLPIIATLISIAGIFGGSTQECDNYRAELERVRLANLAIQSASISTSIAYAKALAIWQQKYYALQSICYAKLYAACAADDALTPGYFRTVPCVSPGYCQQFDGISPPPVPPSQPQYIIRSGCTPPNCPISKKVWLQAIWASQSDLATQTKSCLIVGYSYDKVDGLKIEYNPFKLSESFLKSRSANPDLIAGNPLTKLNEPTWKNLESTVGWDKGYWAAEQTDVECRGWNPGWSRKVK